MSRPLGGQLVFDIDTLIHDADVQAAPPWGGPAPLHFTTAYYTPGELAAAWNHWIFLHGHFDSHALSHMWHPGTPIDPHGQANGHTLVSFSADLRCHWWDHGEDETGNRIRCACVGELLTQGICEPCQWHSIGDQSTVIEAWHDHAWSGWRNLPVIPASIKSREMGTITKRGRAWIEAHYPPEWQVPGAPIITERTPPGTRHVPGYSPWGGYDLSNTALTEHDHQ